MWKWFVILLVLILLIPSVVRAETSAEVMVTASGLVVGSPTGLTFTYISDYEVGLSWTKGEDAVNTLIRRTKNRPPEDRYDGVLVYEGSGESTKDWVDIITAPVVYYRAWSQNAEGQWEEIGASGEANFMSQSFMLLVFLGFALGLMVINFRRRNILLALAASLMWLALAMWLFFGASAPIGLSETWKTIIAWVFFIMLFIPLLLQLDTEVKHEAEGHSWSTWGEEPTRKSSEYEDYRDKLFLRTRSRRRR